LGGGCTSEYLESHAGTPQKIRGESALGLGYSGRRISESPEGSFGHDGRSAQIHGYVAGVRSPGGAGNEVKSKIHHGVTETPSSPILKPLCLCASVSLW